MKTYEQPAQALDLFNLTDAVATDLARIESVGPTLVRLVWAIPDHNAITQKGVVVSKLVVPVEALPAICQAIAVRIAEERQRLSGIPISAPRDLCLQ